MKTIYATLLNELGYRLVKIADSHRVAVADVDNTDDPSLRLVGGMQRARVTAENIVKIITMIETLANADYRESR